MLKRITIAGFIAVGLVFLTACAGILTPARISVSFSQDLPSNKDIASVFSVVLTEYGYNIVLVNEEIGTLITDWHETSESGGLLQVRYKYQVTVDRQHQEINLTITKEMFNNSLSRWSTIGLDMNGSKAQQQMESIITDVSTQLGVTVKEKSQLQSINGGKVL